MKKAKKNRWSEYTPRDGQLDVAALDPAEPRLELTFAAPGERPQRIDLSCMKDRPLMGKLFTKVLWSEGRSLERGTRKSWLRSIRAFNDFLIWKQHDAYISEPSSISIPLLREFAIWLTDVRGVKAGTAFTVYGCIARMLEIAKSRFPQALPSDFEVPACPIPSNSRSLQKRDVLDRAALGLILEAAEKKVEEIRGRYRDGDTPNGLLDLIPFMIIIALRTAINAESLYNMRRDCLTPHVIEEDAFYISWDKKRSKAGVQRQLHYVDPQGKKVVALIQFLIAYTQPLVSEAEVYDRNSLFLYRYVRGEKKVVVCRTSSIMNRMVRIFSRVHGLPDFQMGQLRPSVATAHYKETRGNLRKVQVLLGHKNIETTERYVNDTLVQEMHDESIRAAQDAMLSRVIKVVPKRAVEALHDLAGELSAGQRRKLTDGAYDTGFGKCRNPFDSPQPGQRKGKCCTLFLACLTCPNALFFLEELPRVIALRNHFLALREGMPREIWEELYRERITIIDEEIVGAFSAAQVAEARRLANEIVDIPVLMANGALK